MLINHTQKQGNITLTNNFTTIKENQAQIRFNLVRINPRQYVNDSLASIGGGQYTMTFSSPISAVERNGSAMTLVDTPSGSDEYSYNETTNLLTIQATVDASNIIIVKYYLFYTNGINRVIHEDPENSATTLRDWLPRIKNTPTTDFNIENTTEGILSISNSSIDLINIDGNFQQYLTDNDSFYKCPVQIWMCLNSTDNIQKVFEGLIIDLRLDYDSVIMNVNDPLSYLQDIATMGEDASETYFTPSGWPDMDKNYDGYPSRLYFGTASRYQLLVDTDITGLSDAKKLDPSKLEEAVLTSYSDTISTTTNREWGIGRVGSSGTLDFSFTISNVDNSAGGYTRLDGTAAEIAKFKIGDTFTITSSPDVYVRAVYVDTTNNYLYTTKEAGAATSDVVVANACPSIVVTNGTDETYYCLYGRDYTATETALDSGNKYIKITFEDNFEANHALATLDPSEYTVLFRLRPDTTRAKHGHVLEDILTASGASTNSSTFNAANTALDVQACFSIPQYDETDSNTYLSYAQLILKSTLGYLALNNDFEIEYHLFNTSAASTSITDTEILERSFRTEVDYQDLANEIIMYNPHYASSEAQADSSATPSVTMSSLKSKHLHNINNVIRFRHVLENMSARATSIIDYKSERTARYLFSTSLTNVDNILGDDLTLTKDRLLGDAATKNVTIVGISKSTKKSNIIVTDLLDI